MIGSCCSIATIHCFHFCMFCIWIQSQVQWCHCYVTQYYILDVSGFVTSLNFASRWFYNALFSHWSSVLLFGIACIVTNPKFWVFGFRRCILDHIIVLYFSFNLSYCSSSQPRRTTLFMGFVLAGLWAECWLWGWMFLIEICDFLIYLWAWFGSAN
jgi:hypothetical protein